MNHRDPEEGMSLIVKTVTGWLKAFILLFGIYIVLYGHLTPGGGFAGGVIVACAFILITLGEGQRTALQTLPKSIVSELDSIGALVFVAVACIGIPLGGAVLINFISTGIDNQFSLFSGGIIPICNLGIGLKVGMSLFLVFSMLAAIRLAKKPETSHTEDS